jgi:3-deoxy-D-manno-octulosonic-acid transferase
MALIAYNLLLTVFSPPLLAYLLYRLVVLGKSRAGFHQRLGWVPALPPPPAAGRLWLHAVSAGEVVAAAAIARWLGDGPDCPELVISTTTPAGRTQAERLLPRAAARFFFPFDFIPCMLLALGRVRPTAVAAVETEVWPNWLFLARLQGVRTALVNGQFTDRGFARASRARWLYRGVLRHVDELRLQTQQAADRAMYLGAPPTSVRVVGNVKFEQAVAHPSEEVAAMVRATLGLGDGRPLWIAASTHPGEDKLVVEAFRHARQSVPDLALLLAPRHIERAMSVLDLARAANWSVALRSSGSARPVDILVLDTMGELSGLFALSRVAFIGGSLVPIGGHDLLQPLFHGSPALFGPHMQNQRDLAALALAAGAARRVMDAGELAAEVARCCQDPAALASLKASGRCLLEQNGGAARECAALLIRMAREGRKASGPRGSVEALP